MNTPKPLPSWSCELVRNPNAEQRLNYDEMAQQIRAVFPPLQTPTIEVNEVLLTNAYNTGWRLIARKEKRQRVRHIGKIWCQYGFSGPDVALYAEMEIRTQP